ncbi:MFS transporter [Nostoc sp. CHAB 5715]|uniref:MFS transporter n=1 Tax=Nostoc sp. CHAB 5715 TaxID=2780400 RepID=UPI001E3B8A3B|nr:MFS transporter [Nostoc sp. CHAB 5715]MCC5625294.1 MFS transporter [Nostoc sp. CHAB 5715]
MFNFLQLKGLWQHSDFMKLWLGQTISLFGSAVTNLALPLTAALTLQATPAQMGLLKGAEFVPFLLIGLVVGVWVDRQRRRPILIAADLGRALLLGSVPIAAVFGLLRIEHLYLVAFGTGTLSVLASTASFAFVPTLIKREQLVEGNSKFAVSQTTSQTLGPGLAGILVQWLTAPVAIALDAVSFLLSAVLVLLIRAPEPVLINSNKTNFWQELSEGAQVVLKNPLLRAIACCTSTLRMFTSVVETVYILYVTRTLGFSPAMVGFILATGAFGNLLGVLLTRRIERRLGLGRTIMGAAGIWGISYLFIPLTFNFNDVVILLLVTAAILSGLGDAVYQITQVSLRQALVPNRLQGRMTASLRFIIWSTVPVGAMLGGTLGESFGLQAALWIGAVGSSLAFLWVFCSPLRILRKMPTLIEEP